MTGRRAVVFGASGGIGGALVDALAGSGRYAAIYAGARAVPAAPRPGVSRFAFELCDEESITAAAEAIAAGGPVDLAIVATGMLHEPGAGLPEKSWHALDGEAMARVFAVNTIGPALVAKHVLPLLHRDSRAVFAALSARVGSIADNRLGGWHSYRASKSALNMLVRNFAIEFARRNPEGIVVAVHPGTVATALSRPFRRNLDDASLQQPADSAARVLSVLDSLSPADSGGLFAWDGERIAY